MISSMPINTLVPHNNHRMIQRLASALCCAYNIPQGEQFILLIGNGDESDNQHAVETWVETTLTALDESTAKAILPHLVEKFGVQLQRWETITW